MSEKNEWKLVPVVPTEEMLIALGGMGWMVQQKPESYAAMLAAAPSPAATAPGDAQDERQAFEAWFRRNDETKDMAERAVRRSPSGAYVLMQTYTAWEIWQAARSRAPAAGDALDLTLAQKYEDACIAANANARDAARYRWLRDQTETDGIAIVMKDKHFDESSTCAENIDKFIDAAQVPHKGDAA